MGVVFAICISCASGKGYGLGKMETFDRIVPDFEKIQITGAFSNHYGSEGKSIVRIHSGKENRLSVAINSNLNRYVETNVINNVLNIEKTTKMRHDFIIDIYSPDISGISIDSNGKVEIIDAITVPSFSIEISGAGEVSGNIECEYLSVNVYGAGKVALTGSSKTALINISGAGLFNGREFSTNNVFVDIGGVGRAHVWAVDNLAAGIGGVGSIRYRGNPNVQFNRGGLGTIRKLK
jgi:hypothetical protein